MTVTQHLTLCIALSGARCVKVNEDRPILSVWKTSPVDLSVDFYSPVGVREIMDTIRSRQKRWLGHILRHDSLLRITLEGQIQGKKTYRRPRTLEQCFWIGYWRQRKVILVTN